VVAISPIEIAGEEVKTVNIVAKVPPAAFERGKVTGRYRIRSDGGLDDEREFVLLGPYARGGGG